MPNKKRVLAFWVILSLSINLAFAQYEDDDTLQMINIDTHFHSFIGKPSWLLMIRDLDHEENIPYLFDIRRGENFWVAPIPSRNYLILASTLKIHTYRSRSNTFGVYTIHDFCHLESHGHIMRGQSIYLIITGDLSPNTNTFNCQISTVNN